MQGGSADYSKEASPSFYGSNQKSKRKYDDENEPHNKNANPAFTHKIINITSESLSRSQKQVSIVDPWVPRIANNDEYLQLGLDFSVRNGVDTKDDEKEGDLAGTISPFVGDIGAIRLAGALANNNLLLYLNLSNNHISAEGGVALARSLYEGNGNKSRTALRRLNLSLNRISDEGAMVFRDLLTCNDTLEDLDMSDNGITIDGLLELLEGLRNNDAIKILRLRNNIHSVLDTEMEKLVMNIVKVLKKYSGDLINGSRLEVLEMGRHDTAPNNHLVNDGMLDVHASNLMHAMMYIDIDNSKNIKRVNHRFRILTLPTCEIHGCEIKLSGLQKLLGFNSFYHPVMEFNDLIGANETKDESNESFKTIPIHLQRDVLTGALIGLLPSTTSLAPSTGLGYKLLPRVISFANRSCTLETIYNLIRYRPDMFSCVHSDRSVGCSLSCCIL